MHRKSTVLDHVRDISYAALTDQSVRKLPHGMEINTKVAVDHLTGEREILYLVYVMVLTLLTYPATVLQYSVQ